jgi:hypothetical protein
MSSTIGPFCGLLKACTLSDLTQFNNNVPEDVLATKTVCRCMFTCSKSNRFRMRVGRHYTPCHHDAAHKPK